MSPPRLHNQIFTLSASISLLPYTWWCWHLAPASTTPQLLSQDHQLGLSSVALTQLTLPLSLHFCDIALLLSTCISFPASQEP